MENEELIRQTMEYRRESISEDLGALEDRVTDTVHKVSEAASHTAARLKEVADIKGHVDHHPWLMFGGAIAAGAILGQMLHAHETAARQTPRIAAPPQAPSLLAKELTKVKGLALGMALGFVRQALTADLPPALAGEAGEIIDAMTEKLGGKRLSNSELPSGSRQ